MKRAPAAVAAAVFLVAAVALARDTFFNGHDFEVMWRAGRDALTGGDAYSLDRERGMVFKYPPWTLFFFLPWGLLPLPAAKALWGVLEALSLGAAGVWLRRQAGVGWWVITATGIAFFGLFAVHALDGQIALTILALALWLRPGEQELDPGWRSLALVWALSIKVFTALPLFAFRLGRSWLTTLLVAATLFAAVTLPFGGLPSLLRGWMASAASGGALLGAEHVRGAFNPSFTGAALALAGVPAGEARADVLLAALLASVLGAAWWRLSRRLGTEERWAGWLALVPAIHPLPWWHLFVLAFPASALALDRSFRAPGRAPRMLALLGVFLVAVATHRFLGLFGLEGLGHLLERTAGKSFGILAVLASLLTSSKIRTILKR